MIKTTLKSAFTIVELIVVIAVIGILASIVIVSYGAWRTQTATASVKSDLTHAASAMESYRSFNGGYPTSGLPSTISASAGNTLTPYAFTASSYCIDGSTSISGSIKYHIDNTTQSSGPTAGTCASRANAPAPGPVTGVAIVTGSTQIAITWALASPNNAAQYEVQCAYDTGFITGLLDDTAYGATATTDTLQGANTTTTYYCRVRAINATGQSAWSNIASADTTS